jgi:hypothetical protein
VPSLTRTVTGLLLHDPFTRPDGAPGASYDNASGTWAIASNKLSYGAGTPLIRVVGIDRADLVMQVKRPFINSTDYGGLRLRRAAGGGSFIMFDMGTDTGGARCRIYRWTGAAFVLVAVSAIINTVTYPGAYVWKVVLQGTTASFYLDGVLMCTGAVPAASGVAGDNEVWLGGSASAGNTFDDLVIADGNTIPCSGLPTGWKGRAAGVTAVESGGTATVDTAGALFPLSLVEVLDAGDVVRGTFAGDVWGGDEFSFPAPEAPEVEVSRIRRTTVYVTPSAFSNPSGAAHAVRRARVRRISTDTLVVAAAVVALSGGFYLQGLPEGPAGAGGRPVADPDLMVEVQDEDALGIAGAWGVSDPFQTLNLWESGEFVKHLDVLIERPDGETTVMQSYRDFGGRNWIKSLRLVPASVDSPIGSGVLTLHRQVGADSLAPLVTASPLNSDGVGYAPALDFGREVEVRACITAVGGRVTLSAPADEDDTSLAVEALSAAIGTGSVLHFSRGLALVSADAALGATTLAVEPLLNAFDDEETGAVSAAPTEAEWEAGFHWRGITDDPEWPRKAGDITVPVRDYSGRLADTMMRFESHYGDEDTPVDAFVVLQAIADDYMGAGQYTLQDETVGDRFMVTSYTVADVFVWEALQTLALQWGGKALRQVDGPEESYLAVIEPDRAKTVPDYAVGPGTYLEVATLTTAGKKVRTIVRGRALDSATGEIIESQLPAEEDVETDPLVLLYGPIFFQFDEEEAKGINSQAELDAMVAAIYADLKTPPIPLEPETKFCPFAAVDDLVEWGANTVLFDQPLSAAVLGLVHNFPAPGVGRTSFACAGSPKGALDEWLRRGVEVAGISRRPAMYDVTLTQDGSNALLEVGRFNNQVVGWSAWGAIDESPLASGIPLDRFLLVERVSPQVKSASWGVRNGTLNVLIRALAADGTFVSLTRTLLVTGIGNGEGEPPSDVPSTPTIERGPMVGALREITTTWTNTRTDLVVEIRYTSDGEVGDPITLAVGADSHTVNTGVPQHVRAEVRYTGDDGPGAWSPSSPEVFLPGGL